MNKLLCLLIANSFISIYETVHQVFIDLSDTKDSLSVKKSLFVGICVFEMFKADILKIILRTSYDHSLDRDALLSGS